MKDSITSEKIKRLPPWAQKYIAILQRREQAAVKELDEFRNELPQSRVQILSNSIDRGALSWVSLPSRTVRFQVGNDWIQVSLSDYSNAAKWKGKSIELTSSYSSLVVAPQASNRIEVSSHD